MKKRSSASARIAAAATLVVAFVVALVVIGGSLGGDSEGPSGSGGGAQRSQPAKSGKKIPSTYEVKRGDTLISIAHRMGISVARIERLNPEVDPQILATGEQLKLR